MESNLACNITVMTAFGNGTLYAPDCINASEIGENSNVTEPQYMECSPVYHFIIYTLIGTTLCILGIIGNILSFVVFYIDTLKTSTTFLFQGLAVTDTLLLFTCIPLYSVKPFTDMLGYTPYKVVHAFVLVYIFPMAMIFQTATIWLTVLVGINRYIAVCMPYQAPKLCTVSKARQYIFGIYLFAIIYNLPRFLSGKIGTDPETNITQAYHTAIGRNRHFNIIYNNILYLIFMLALPVLILVLLNIRLINTLKELKKKRSEMQTRQQQQDNNVTFVLIIVILVFTVCQFPALVNQILWNVLSDEHRECYGFQTYFSGLSNLMVMFNSAVNFVIYILFNKKFKSVMIQNFCMDCVQKRYSSDEKKRRSNGTNGATQTLLTHV